MKPTFWSSVARFGLCLSALSLIALPCFAQQTLGSINGTVVDPTGAAIAGAAVTVTDEAINVTETATTQRTGFFQIFNLPVGTYTVKATHEGFGTTEIPSITVQEARATTVDIALKVGQASESVEVTANPMLNATDATNGYTLDHAQIEITPLATGSFTQLATLAPGVNAELLSGIGTNAGLGNQPIWANGQRDTSNTFQVNGADATNLFNGKSSSGSTSQRYNFNIGGGSTSSSSSAGQTVVGGAAPTSTSVYGSNGNSLPSPPPEFLQELRVNASLYDAQQGATSGAQIDVNTSTGSNNWHGQVFGTFANNDLNANPYFFNQEAALAAEGVGAFPQSLANPGLHRWTLGGAVGGPIVKNKVFFFAGYQRLYDSDDSTGISQMNVPSALTDDRTQAGLDNAATVWNNGKSFTSPIASIASALLNAKLPNGEFMIPSAQTSSPYQFGVHNVTLLQKSLLTSDQGNAAVDYDLTKTDRISAKYYYQSDPVNSPFGISQVEGFPVTQNNGSQVATIDNTISIGPRLNWEQRVGFVRMGSYSFLNQTVGGGSNFGVGADGTGYKPGLPGLLLKEFASSSSVDAPALKLGPFSSFADIGYYQNRVNPSTNVIFSLGQHTIVAGGGFSYTQLNITNNRDGIAQVETKNFEKFLADSVSSSNVLETIDANSGRNNADRYYRSNEIAGYVQDKWQILPNLSLTGGVRYDYHGGLTEKYGNMFNFDPSTYDVTGTSENGFLVNNAGFVVAGNNKYHPTAGVSDSTLSGRQWGISPRLGFAWSPKNDQGKVVFAGGAGIYYDRGELLQYLSQPAGSGNGGPFGVTESAPLASYVVGNGNDLSNPLGTALTEATYIPPSSDPGTIKTALQNQLNIMTGNATGYDAKFGKNCGAIDNQEGYTDCTATLNFGAYDKNNVLPYTVNYGLSMQWQPTNDVAVLIGYAGNRGRHAVIPIPFNEPQIATPASPAQVLGKEPHANGEIYSYGFQVLNQNSFKGYDYNSITNEPWNTLDGGNTDFRAPYVGYSPNAALFETVGNSAYDALETHIEKRMSHNFQLGASYTWSHSLDEQSDIGLFFTGDDPAHLHDSWASSDFDRTNVFSGTFQAAVPNTARARTALAYLANDWHLNGAATVQSGEPYSLYEFYGAVGSVRFGNYPTLMNPVLAIKDPTNPKTALTGNNGAVRQGSNYVPTIDPTQLSIKYVAPGDLGVPPSVGNEPQDIYETDFVPGQRNIFRQAPQKRLDLSLRKSFHPTERLAVQYEFNVFNVTNTTSLDVPQDQTQIRQNSACSNSAISEGNNCSPGEYYYVNYGQIVTSSSAADQQSAKTNLDQFPYHNGSGKSTTIPTLLPVGALSCTSGNSVSSAGCPNNGANFGSVTGTIGGNRVITMGMHITF